MTPMKGMSCIQRTKHLESENIYLVTVCPFFILRRDGCVHESLPASPPTGEAAACAKLLASVSNPRCEGELWKL